MPSPASTTCWRMPTNGRRSPRTRTPCCRIVRGMAAKPNDRRHPMIRTLISLAVLSALLAAGSADAQERKKLYRWVDKDGKVQFSDALPPDAVAQARTEINSVSGRATASVDRALTDEERIAKEKEDAEKARLEKDAEHARMTEEAMI